MMREEYSAPGTNSPPAPPSAWQLRFGKKSSSRLQSHARSEADTRSHHQSEAKSPSISEQLLRALNTKSIEKEETSRACVDELIGRRNAFVAEPDLRPRSQTKRSEDDIVPEHNGFEGTDVAAEAKEIIRARLHIETKADSLRQAPVPKRKTEIKSTTKPHAATRTPTNLYASSRATVRLDKTTNRGHEKKNPRTSLEYGENDNQTAKPARFQTQSVQHQRRSSSTCRSRILNKTTRPRHLPPKQIPMEHRQQLLQQTREARKIKAAEDKALQQLQASVGIDNNKEERREQRRIEEQIERLTLENQEAAALEERLQNRRSRVRYLRKVFEGWQRCVENRRELQTRVLADFKWRTLQSLVTQWKRYTHRQRQARIAEHARLKLLRQQQVNEQATIFHRSRCLPKWFYRWATFVTHQKEQRATERVAETRRAQTERLMERLIRQKTVTEELQPNSAVKSESENDPDHDVQELPPAIMIQCPPTVHQHTSRKTTTSSGYCQRKSAWTSTEDRRSKAAATKQSEGEAPAEASVHSSPSPILSEASLTRTTKTVDKVYKAMEQRAVERKQRREELRKRYAVLEQKKREQQEEQREAREALILQRRKEEKASIRERKLAEATELKEKQERRDYMIAQRHKANKFNRTRLLFYCAILPWRKHHELSKRVTRNACRWHDLRTVYSHWGRWLEFVQIRRKLHRHRERAQLQEAARHYAQTLQRRILWGLMRYHQAVEARALAVRRQNQWNRLQSSWHFWYKRLLDERAYRWKVAFEGAAILQQKKLRRICAQWRKVTCDAKLQHALEREKQQLWRKVRGWLDEEDK